MSVRDTAVKILDECRARIQANMAKRYRSSHGVRWITASGRSSAAFKVVEEKSKVRLVYRGDGVAPLSSLQDGTTGVAPVRVLAEWIEAKGLNINPWAVRESIKRRGGTERHFEPQEWVIQPEIDRAVEELRRELPASAAATVRERLFRR